MESEEYATSHSSTNNIRKNEITDNDLICKTRRRALTGAERSKFWYYKKKLAKIHEQFDGPPNAKSVLKNLSISTDNVIKKPKALTGAERSKLWYYRKKLARRNLHPDEQSNVDTKVESRKATTSAEKSKLWYKRKKLSIIIPLHPDQILCTESQNSECILPENDSSPDEDTAMETSMDEQTQQVRLQLQEILKEILKAVMSETEEFLQSELARPNSQNESGKLIHGQATNSLMN